MTKSLDVDCEVWTAYCKSSSGNGVDWFQHSIMYRGGLLRLVHYVIFQSKIIISKDNVNTTKELFNNKPE